MARLPALATLLLCAVLASAQAPALGPTVNPDRSITFRVSAPAATAAGVALDLYPVPLPMSKGPDGIWTLTTPPLEPEYYGYDLVLDGVTQLDPFNPDVRYNFVYLTNQVLVPGGTTPGTHPSPWDMQSIPHGRVDRQRYTSQIVQHLPNSQSAYIVYTPPSYDPARKGGYPVLYLLHGWSDNESAWTLTGRADLILDSLIASGQAVPMIVVMPFGYGDLDFVLHGFSVWSDPDKVRTNVSLFTQALFTEVMPAVESTYNVAKGRDNHAIAGLSMGGLESLSVGLNHPDRFAWVGSMSAALLGDKGEKKGSFDKFLPHVDARSSGLRLLWVSCGSADPLVAHNRDFIAWARQKGLTVTSNETPFGHTWLSWRSDLVQFAPLLFQPGLPLPKE